MNDKLGGIRRKRMSSGIFYDANLNLTDDCVIARSVIFIFSCLYTGIWVFKTTWNVVIYMQLLCLCCLVYVRLETG